MDDFLKFQELRPKSTSSGEIVQQLMVMSLYVLMLPVLKSDSIYEDVFLSDDLVVKTSTSRKFNLEAKQKKRFIGFPFATRFSSFFSGRKNWKCFQFSDARCRRKGLFGHAGDAQKFQPFWWRLEGDPPNSSTLIKIRKVTLR